MEIQRHLNKSTKILKLIAVIKLSLKCGASASKSTIFNQYSFIFLHPLKSF